MCPFFVFFRCCSCCSVTIASFNAAAAILVFTFIFFVVVLIHLSLLFEKHWLWMVWCSYVYNAPYMNVQFFEIWHRRKMHCYSVIIYTMAIYLFYLRDLCIYLCGFKCVCVCACAHQTHVWIFIFNLRPTYKRDLDKHINTYSHIKQNFFFVAVFVSKSKRINKTKK